MMHYPPPVWCGGDHGMFVKGWVGVDLVRDARGEVCGQGRERVGKLGIGIVEADMEDGV